MSCNVVCTVVPKYYYIEKSMMFFVLLLNLKKWVVGLYDKMDDNCRSTLKLKEQMYKNSSLRNTMRAQKRESSWSFHKF